MREEVSFQDLTLPRVIDTASTDFIEDFYNPLLSRSRLYQRGVGYFSLNWIRSAARGVAYLANDGGTAQWLASPKLEESDWRALQRGDEAKRDDILKESLEATITDLRYELEYDTRNAVAWMIADGLLEIKLAVPTHRLTGDFHDKFGIFYDDFGNRVAFHGSQNDSAHALENYEAYTIDCDWVSDREMEAVDYQEQRFIEMWDGDEANIEVYSIPEAAEAEITELRESEQRPYDCTPAADTEESGVTLRGYQQDAVDAWFSNDCRGIFQMATGTGKTFAALGALDEYLDTIQPPSLTVIAVPQNHLARQWADEMDTFGLPHPKYVYGSANKEWKRDLSRIVSNARLGTSDHSFVVTTHTTLASEKFRGKIDGFSENAILIADEVHGLGSDYQRQGLLTDYDARIGLSATPERYYDEEGSQSLLDYFDGVTFEYTLEDAIPEHLTPYEYHPIPVEMDVEELEEYRKMTQKVAAGHSSEDTSDEVQQILQSQRASIVKRAIRKYDALREILESLDNPQHLLVYTNTHQIEAVGKILNEFGIIHHKFTYEEDNNLREELLERFEQGEWEALVAMKCLDEGVDVPATRTAILMSNSGNPMQFVQRRGRVLRKTDGKTHATIFDLVVVPTMEPGEQIIESERNILRKELKRFEEFASAAKNEHSARNRLEDIRIAYRI